MYGHRKDAYSQEIGDTLLQQKPREKEHLGEGPERQVREDHGGGDDGIQPEVVEQFGPWMLAKRRTRRNSLNQDDKGVTKGRKVEQTDKQSASHVKPKMVGTQSKFSILNVEGEEEMVLDENENMEGEFFKNMRIDHTKKHYDLGMKGRRPNVQVQNNGESHLMLAHSSSVQSNMEIRNRSK